MRLATLSALVALFAYTASAAAHTTWSAGQPIPSWVKEQCCGVADAHHLTPDQVHETEHGYIVDGYQDKDGTPRVIPFSHLLPSQDGDWWVFYRTYDDGSVSPVYCFFGVMGT